MKNEYLILFLSCLLLAYHPSSGQLIDRVSADGDAEVNQTFTSSPAPQSIQSIPSFRNIQPGDSIEGDYIRGMKFFDQGDALLVCHFLTNNISVIDWNLKAPIASIELAGAPMYVDVLDNKAVATLPLEDQTMIIDLNTLQVSKTINTAGEPNQVHIDPVSGHALVSSVDSQRCYVIDLSNDSLVGHLDSFYSGIQSFSFITSNNRSDFHYFDFAISSDGQKAISIDVGGNGIRVHDILSGSADTTFAQIDNPFSMAAADSNMVLVLNNGTVPAIYQIDLDSLKLDSIVLTGLNLFSLCRDIAPSASGEEVILGMGTGLVKADFGSGTFSQVSSNTVFWLQPSFDHQYAMGGGFYSQLVDIAQGTVIGTSTGLSQSKGAVADSSYYAIGVDALRKEYLHSFDFGAGGLNLLSDISSGTQEEADAPYRVALSDDGEIALVSNQLSKSASVLYSDSNQANDLVSGMNYGSFGCALSSNGELGLVADYEDFSVKAIDINAGSTLSTVPVGDRPSIIRIVPGDTLALVTNTRANTVTFMRIEPPGGPNPNYEVTALNTIPVGIIGVSWTNQGIFSDLRISPDGEYALLAASFDNDVKVIDLQSRSVVATLAVGLFPSQIAFSSDGQRAAVLNKNDNTFSLLQVDGANSSVLGTFNTANNPTRVDYDPYTDQFLISNSGVQSVQFFDGQTGSLNSAVGFGPDQTPIQVNVLYSGRVAYLLAASGADPQSYLRINGTDYPLPARPCYMDVADSNDVVAVTMSGPDWVSIFRDDTLLSYQQKGLIPDSKVDLFPNPSNGILYVKTQYMGKRNLPFQVIDQTGKVLISGELDDRTVQDLDLNSIPSGLYLLRVQGYQDRKFIKH